MWIILSNEEGLPLKAFKVDKTNSALDFLYLQTIPSFASDRFLEKKTPQHCVLSITTV